MEEKESDPTKVSILSFTNAHLPLYIPRPKQLVRIGSGFDPSLLNSTNGPWKTSAFETEEQHRKSLVLELGGNQSSYRKSLTFSAGQTSEHFSASLGLTVGNAALSGSVSGSYDKVVAESKHGTQASRLATCRLGRVVLCNTSSSVTARSLVKSADTSAFRTAHGDYFVSGYVLGAERASNLRAIANAKSEREETSVTVTVQALWLKDSVTKKESFQSACSSAEVRVMGYDTLNSRFDCLSNSQGYDSKDLEAIYGSISHAVETIESDLAQRMSEMRLGKERSLSLIDCDRLFTSGLVNQLVLLPYSVLPITAL